MGEYRDVSVAGRNLRLGTGEIARQAGGAVVAQYGDTVVLVTVVSAPPRSEAQDFFPLTVDYRERTYAAGKIPGGFFKREGRPREKEILTSRLIDRSIRPLFPRTYKNEVQVMVTVLSADQENDSDVPAIIGAGAALAVSEIPFSGPVAAVCVGRINGQLVINPTLPQLDEGDLDLIVSGTRDAIVMVEGGARELEESALADALDLAHKQIVAILDKVDDLVKAIGKAKIPIPPSPIAEESRHRVSEFALERVRRVVRTKDKAERDEAFRLLKTDAAAAFSQGEPPPIPKHHVLEILEDILHAEARGLILNEGVRSDGRKPVEIRPITCAVGLLPRTHGSALFTRGQTQALVTTTLGTTEDQQIMDELVGRYKKKFLVHYNFPPFSTGEVKPNRGVGRREVGHGMLAQRALAPILPVGDAFPYTVRVVSDILESNGSSSMASVCGGSLSLMDAGVPVSSAVAGVAMGLITERGKAVILTDIMGLEDHLGDMDFKVAGTKKGITAVQMDIKTTGITVDLMRQALGQARDGRLFILGEMDKSLSAPRQEMSVYAPRMITIQIHPDKIREVIGSGGKTIRRIIEQTGANVDVEDDGKVYVSAVDPAAVEQARQMIQYLTADAEIGKLYKGKVARITNFGAFVEILPGKDGLVRIPELSEKRVERVEDVVHEGDEITVKCIEVDAQGRVNLSKRLADMELRGEAAPIPPPQRHDRGDHGHGRRPDHRGGRGGHGGRGGRGR